jgi:hypothetical protein
MNKVARSIIHIPVRAECFTASEIGLKRGAAISLSRCSWVGVLIVSLLFAQFAGLLHRIEHAKWLGDQESSKLQSKATASFISDSLFPSLSDGGKKNINHSCAAFDAATLADTLSTPGCDAVFRVTENYAPYFVTASSWEAPVVHHYSSRAPPPVSI